MSIKRDYDKFRERKQIEASARQDLEKHYDIKPKKEQSSIKRIKKLNIQKALSSMGNRRLGTFKMPFKLKERARMIIKLSKI